MAKTKIVTGDDYFDRLAEATEENGTGSAWLNEDYSGQLAVDVYDTNSAIIIRAAIAGVQAGDIDITVNNDMVTIKGMRQIEDEAEQGAYLYQECYWGGFSRTIILPFEVDAENVKAALKNGILRVVVPKLDPKMINPITVVDEDEA